MAKENIYPYAVAKIRVYEKNLLTKQNFIQMAEAKDINECIRIFSNNKTSFEADDFEQALSTEMAQAYELMKELVPEENFVNIFLCKNDYHNVKVLIKSELSGADAEKYIIQGGILSVDLLKKAIFERNYSSLPKIMENSIKEAYDIYSKSQNAQYIDMVIDKACFEYMTQIAKESKNNFIIKFIEKLSDITNLKSFERIRRMNKNFDNTFKFAFVSGGTISFETFRQASATDNPALTFKITDYYSLCEAMGNDFTLFEKLCDNYLMSYVKSAKYMPLTLEPLIAYIYAKETEIKIARIIIASKLNNIDSDTIKERLREAYV